MAATQDDILQAIKELTQEVKKGNTGRRGKSGSAGDSSISNGKYGSSGDMMDDIASIKQNSDRAKRAKRLKNEAKAKGHSGLASTAAKSGMKAKASIGAVIADVAASAAKKIADFAVKMQEFEFKEKSIRLQAAAKSLQVQTALYGEAISKAVSVGANSVVGDIKEVTYQAMEGTMEMGKKNLLSNISLSQIQFEKNTDIHINSMKQTAAAVGAVADEVSGVLGAIPNPYTAIASAVVSIANSIFQAKTEVDIMKAEFAKEQMAVLSDFKKDVVEQAEGAVKPFVDLTKSVDKILMELDNNAHTIGRSFGFAGEQIDLYTKGSAQLNIKMAELGKTYEDLMKSQQAYIAESGRNVLMSGEEGQMVSSLDTLFNLSDGEAAQLMGAMNIFNTSIESGSDMMFEMYKTANKIGISNQKFAKDLQKNLKLAEKYQFKGGVEGMMKMSLWAQKVRFNMDSLSAALDKMHTGNIEDVIQTSAKLNVLGGNAAILSDPMSMLYNAYADPAQYAKNMQQMVSGFGHFNKNTGETEFNINEQMRMEAMASAMGISKEEFFNMARQEKKSKAISGVLGNKYNEEQRDLITQHATFNRKTKKWEVNVMDEKGEVHAKDINNLNDQDLKSIFPEDTQEQLVEYTKGIFSLLQKQKSIENTNKGEIAALTQETHRQQTELQFALTERHNKVNRAAYAAEVEKGFMFSTESLAASLEQAQIVLSTTDKNGKTLTDNYYAMSLAGMNDISTKIGAFQEAMNAMMEGDMNDLITAMSEINLEAAQQIVDAIQNTASQDSATRDQKAEAARMLMSQYGYANGIDKNTSISWDSDDAFWQALSDIYDIDNDFLRTNAGTIVDDIRDGDIRLTSNGELVDKNGKTVELYNVIESEQSAGHKATQVHDAFWTPKGDIYTDPEDMLGYIAAKPGGELSQAIQNTNSIPQNLNLNINGSLRLDASRFSVDILELLRNDPKALRELAKEIIVEVSRTTFGGKSQWAPNRYTFGN